MSRVASFFRIAAQVGRSRLFRALVVVAAVLWGLDTLIFLVTQRSFFASVGLERWFWRELGAQIALFGVFFGLCLGLTRLFLGTLTRASLDESPPLRGVLAQAGPLRQRVSRVSWALALIFALVLAHRFAAHSLDWIFLRSGARSDFAFLGIGAALWTHFLPVFEPFLRSLWAFSLALGTLLLATGVLRALPLLAARNAAPPQLSRVLWRFGAWLWTLRALIYAVQTLNLARGRALSSGDLLLLAPFYALGALACLFLGAAFWRRATQTVFVLPRAKSSRLVLGALAALFLPAILSVLSAPLRAFLPETPFLKRQREAATRAAWRLPSDEKAPAAVPAAVPDFVPIEQIWPVWDAQTLLASRGGAARSNSRIVTWKSVTLGFEAGQWRALLVGDSAGASALNSAREAEFSNAFALQRLDWDGKKWVEGAPLAASAAFFGLESRALFGKEGGIPLASLPLQWAWAWRLRDLLLPVDSANSPHLLTFRGARERAQMLAPFLSVAGEPQLVFEAGKLEWHLDSCAATRHFPGAPPLFQGEFSGANAVSSPIQMRLDARSGAVRFVAARSARGNGALLASWRAAFPEIELSDAAIGVGPALLSAQATVAAQNRAGQVQIAAPQRAFDAQNGALWRVLVMGKNDFEIWQSAPTGTEFQRGAGEVRARLERLDAAAAPGGGAPNQQPGEPFAWRDARAPGGFWLARGFFAALSDTIDAAPNTPQIAANGPVLARVAVAGIAANARVGVGDSLQNAFLAATGQSAAADATSKPPLNLVAPPSAPLEIQALRTHQELQAATKRGDWKAFGALDARQTALLRQLAARRQNPTPKPTP